MLDRSVVCVEANEAVLRQWMAPLGTVLYHVRRGSTGCVLGGCGRLS